jgi:hypothetical protein
MRLETATARALRPSTQGHDGPRLPSAAGQAMAASAPSRAWSGRLGDGSELLSPEAGLALAVAVLLPVALFLAGLGPLNRALYPATAFAAAAYLYVKRSPWYVGLCIWLFCATPLVRRLTDFQAGWDPTNPVLLAPYLACLLAALSFLPYALRDRPTFVAPFVAMLACVGYGLTLAVVEGRTASGLVDALRWSAGPLCAVHLLRHADRQPALHRVVVTSFLVALPPMAVYGVVQFMTPAAWDRAWMSDVVSLGLVSIGQPAPFEVRVFGTMNSPASFAAVLTVGLIASLGRPLGWALPALLVMGLALGLTQYRAGWGGTLIGVACLALAGSAKEKLRVALASVLLVLSTGLLAAVPEVNRTIAERFDTLTRLSSDESGEERLQEYGRFFSQTEGLILGQGLAVSGATRRLDGQAVAVIDGGLTEPFLALGVFGGTIFLAGVAGAFGATFSWGSRACGHMPLYRAIAVANLVQLPFGRVLIGEHGFGMWLFIGLALAAIVAQRQAEELAPGARVTAGQGR